jgi:hypothetical protein
MRPCLEEKPFPGLRCSGQGRDVNGFPTVPFPQMQSRCRINLPHFKGRIATSLLKDGKKESVRFHWWETTSQNRLIYLQ